MVNDILSFTNDQRTILLNELIDNASDPIIVKRRMRMLKHLALYESQLIEKLADFDSNDYKDFIDSTAIKRSILSVVHRSA